MPTVQQSTVPRSKLIVLRSLQAIQGSGLNVLKFSTRVAENYTGSFDALDRSIDFRDPGMSLKSALRAERANGDKIDRYLKGEVRLPCDLEEAIVDSLPEPFRSDLVRELAQRYGLLGAKLPDQSHDDHIACLADVLTDAGRTAQALAPMFAKGRLDITDVPRVTKSLQAIDQALGDLQSLRAQIQTQLPSKSLPRSRRR